MQRLRQDCLKCLYASAALLLLAGCATIQADRNQVAGTPAPPVLNSAEVIEHIFSDQTQTAAMQSTEAASDATVLTLAQVQSIALEKNPTFAEFAANRRAALAEVLKALAYPNPDLEVGLDSTLEMYQPIEFPGKRQSRRNAAEASKPIVEREADVFRATLTADVARAYYTVLYYKHAIALAEESLRIEQEIEQIVGRRVDGGEAPEIDRIKAQVESLKASRAVQVQKRQYLSARVVLNTLCGRSLPADFVLEDTLDLPLAGVNMDAAAQIALAQHPLLRKLDAVLQQKELILEREQKAWFPSLRLGIPPGLELPLWDRNKGGIMAAKAELEKTQAELERARQEILSDVETNTQTYESVREQLAASMEDCVLPPLNYYASRLSDIKKGKWTFFNCSMHAERPARPKLNTYKPYMKHRTPALRLNGPLESEEKKMKHNHNNKTLVLMFLTLVILALGALAYAAIQNKKAQAKSEPPIATMQTPHVEDHDGDPDEEAAEAGHGIGDGHDHDPAEEAVEAGHGADDGHGHGQPGEGGEAHLDEVTLTPEAIQQNGIRVEAVNKQAIGEILTVPGRVSYNMEQMAHVGTPVQGRVAELKVKLGDSVENGDELLVIDSPALGEAQSDFLQKRTQVEVAASAVEVAKMAAERAKRLLEGKGISLGEYQRRDGEYKFATGTHKSAKSALTAAENTLHLYGVGQEDIDRLIATGEINPRYTVHAPISGQVVQREATLGEVVGPEREALLILADMKTLWVLADVPENQIRLVAINSQSTVTLDALGGQQFKGYVSYIAPELNEETRTAQVRVVIEDGAAPISPGMFAQVHLVCEQTADKEPVAMLAVPESAVQMYEGGPTVFVEVTNEPGAFAARPVKTGISNGKAVPILAGLDEGERVVVDGAFVIKAELVKGIMEGKTCSGH